MKVLDKKLLEIIDSQVKKFVVEIYISFFKDNPKQLATFSNMDWHFMLLKHSSLSRDKIDDNFILQIPVADGNGVLLEDSSSNTSVFFPFYDQKNFTEFSSEFFAFLIDGVDNLSVTKINKKWGVKIDNIESPELEDLNVIVGEISHKINHKFYMFQATLKEMISSSVNYWLYDFEFLSSIIDDYKKLQRVYNLN